MKFSSMIRYAPLLLGISLLAVTGCSQPSQETSINTNGTTNASQPTVSRFKTDQALNDLNITLNLITISDENETQLNEAVKNLSILKELYDSNQMKIDEDQDYKLRTQLKEAKIFLSEGNIASAEQSIDIAKDILKKTEEPPTKKQASINPEEIKKLNDEIQQLRRDQNSISIIRWQIPFPLAFAKGSGLIGIISFIVGVAALSRVKKQRDKVYDQGSKIKDLKNDLENCENDIDREIKPTIRDQRDRIVELERVQKLLDTNISRFNTPPPVTEVVSFIPPIQPSQPIQPKGPSKSGLIAALNNGDRQQLREAALSELNITSESENAFITGRSANTELEEVTGGGSYLLVMLQGQPWLFPTEKTLKGFTAVQSSKGMFESEQKTIANCQLLEPALLEGSGNRWTIKKIGRIAIP